MARQLTAKQVDALKPRPQRYEVTEEGGLGVRVTPQGTKSFFYFYKEGGRIHRLTLGTYLKAGDIQPAMSLKTARAKLVEAKARRERGEDPARVKEWSGAKTPQGPTVEAFARTYLDRWARINKAFWPEEERILKREVLPIIGKLRLSELGRKDLVGLVNGIRDRGAEMQANRTLAVMRRMLDFAVEQRVLEQSPAIHIKQSWEQSGDRVLTREAIQALVSQFNRLNLWPPTRGALEFILRTAQQPGEVRAMEWKEVDWARRVWAIPPDKAKSGRSHVVPLPPKTLRLLEEMQGFSSNPSWAFPAIQGTTCLSECTLTHALRRAINPAERVRKDPKAEPIIEQVTPYDLRRTAATFVLELGFQQGVVDKLLNPRDRSVGGEYERHPCDSEKRRALEAWEKELESLR